VWKAAAALWASSSVCANVHCEAAAVWASSLKTVFHRLQLK